MTIKRYRDLGADLPVVLALFGMRERTFQRPIHTFVTISVDGDQQLQTELSADTLTPRWSFSPPLRLYVVLLSFLFEAH